MNRTVNLNVIEQVSKTFKFTNSNQKSQKMDTPFYVGDTIKKEIDVLIIFA